MGGKQASASGSGVESPQDLSDVTIISGQQTEASENVETSEGVSPCNTPLSTTHLQSQGLDILEGLKSGIRVLQTGVDSLYLGYYIDNANDWFYRSIQACKAEAQGMHHSVLVLLKVEDLKITETFELFPAGTKGFPYVLHNENYHLKIFGKGKTGYRPRVSVQIMSKRIQEMGLMESITRIEKLLRGSVGTINMFKSGISRIDIFTDILVDASEFDFHLRELIRSKTTKRHYSEGNKELQTLYIGARDASLQGRIYDKVAQQVETPKGDLDEYLKSVGLEELPDGKKIIRTEFEIKREKLNELRLKEIGKLPGSVATLWNYCTKVFVWMVEESKGVHTEREVLHPWWVVVQGAHGQGSYEVQKVRREYKKPSQKAAWQAVDRVLNYFMGVELVYNPKAPNRRIDAWLKWRDTEPIYNDNDGKPKSDFALEAFDLSQKLRDPNDPLELEDGPLIHNLSQGEDEDLSEETDRDEDLYDEEFMDDDFDDDL